MFKRKITPLLKSATASFPVTVLTGPRQSGKTTLLRQEFPDLTYVSLESPDHLYRAKTDPRAFLDQHKLKKGLIIDEAQNVPELFSYIQEYVDLNGYPGIFILSGSQNFLLLEKVSQTLAGRSAILELLPLSYDEFISDQNNDISLWDYLYTGSYPRIYHQNLNRDLWWQSYLKTYIERDVRRVINIQDLVTFQRFLKVCAARHGQLLNLSNLGVDVGIAQSTAKQWLNLLESSYLTYRLTPHYQNYKKRIVKTPKLYFYDSGLVCHLLGIDSSEHLSLHSARGAIFEGFVIAELAKSFYQRGKTPPLYFWRDHLGVEVDCLIEQGEQLTAIEIKSGQTINDNFYTGLKYWQKISQNNQLKLIYAGDQNITLNGIETLSWRDISRILNH